ncbi:hypothetical protein [Microbacterium invictum]|uniref:Uncharacterized protein n=1 Tax=Microbacterium invictum TaxID=515415 RepID=A0ABZ0V9Q6_9MICO|nr:hypothetical protein [Microbacterium invictum]WQB70348.1 hypothetical protein T9R20_16880 [Microbacterium invictum]
MDTAVTGRYPRLVRLALAGLGVAIGWMLVSFVLGLSSSSALADESQDSGGLLGAVTTVADGGADAVGAVAQPVADTAGDVVGGGTATVEKVAEPVTDTAGAVVSSGAGTVEKVAEPVSHTVEPVSHTVEKVAEPVAETVETVAEPVSTVETVAEPVTDTVEKVAEPVTDTVQTVAEPVTDTTSTVLVTGTETLERATAPKTTAADTVIDSAVDTVEGVASPVTNPVLEIVGDPVTEVVGGGASAVDGTVDALTGTVGTVVDGVTDTAGDLLDAAPLQPIVSPVADVASSALDTVGGLTESVGEQGPVTGVVDVVTGVVEHTPIVGEVADELGIPGAVEQVGGSLDDGVESVGETIGGSGENLAPATPIAALPVVRPPLATERPGSSGSAPVSPTETAEDSAVGATTAGMDAAAAASFAASGIAQIGHRLTGAASSPAGAIMPHAVAADSNDTITIAATTERGGPLHSPGGVLPGDATAAASGGTGLGAWGLIAFGPLFAYRAWMRRVGPEDDRLPGAPIFETDASPD